MLEFPNNHLPPLNSLGIIGTGKLGQMIQQQAQKQGLHVVAINRSSTDEEHKNLLQTQVWIDVSSSEGLQDRLKKAKELHIPVVVGTTGIDSIILEWKKKHLPHDFAVLVSPNFNPMVSLFYHVCESIYTQVSSLCPIQSHIKEIHHIHKKDAPSGTALELYKRLEKIGAHPDEIEAIREGDIKGTHTLELTGPSDKWTIEHQSLNRESFANGALLAAQWMIGRRGFYHFQDVIRDLTPLKI